MPYPGPAGPSVPGAYMAANGDMDPMDPLEPCLTQTESEQELQTLLQHVQYAEDVTPPEQRLSTPVGMTVNLLEHQKLGT